MVATATQPRSNPIFDISLDFMQKWSVWLLFACSFAVTFEPAPVEFVFLLVAACFLRSGLNLSVVIAPLVVFLLLYNLGGFISFLEVLDDRDAVFFVITSLYMAITGIFFAYYVAYDPVNRMKLIKSGYVFGAVIAAILGLLGYFDVAGLASIFQKYGRAVGLFKDPNVFSTYLIPPAIMLLQGLLLGTEKRPFVSLVGLTIMLGAIFLAFSRGAWINMVMSSFLLITLTFLLSPQSHMRSRIVLISFIGLIGVAALLAVLLSIKEIRELFLDRFTLVKSYDAGEKGRFGNQLNSLPILLERPFGFGPTYYRAIFGIDPHNVFLNAFSSYGWLGGMSYLFMTFSTIYIGLKTVLTRSPWQRYAIVVWCPLVSVIFQGVQIDTDHWRHFYWLTGLMWGLFAATLQPSAVAKTARFFNATNS